MQKPKPKKLSTNHQVMLRRRGLDPKNFELVKETYGTLYVRDIRDGKLKIINKKN